MPRAATSVATSTRVRALRLVTVNRCSADALAAEALGEPVRPALGPGEDERSGDLVVCEEREEQAKFARPVHEVDGLRDRLPGRGDRVDGHFHRLVQQPARELADLARLGGREEQRLALARKRLCNAANIGNEAHVEHAVGLIEDEHLHLGEVHLAVAHQVEESSGSGDQDVDAAAQRGYLGSLADAAEDDGAADATSGRVAPEALGDLCGELTRRGQHQGADRLAETVGLDAQEFVEDGQGKGRGLSGAGLGAGEQVAGLERVGNGGSLNRSRFGVAEGLDDGDQFGVEIQGLEAARRGARAGFSVQCRGRQMDILSLERTAGE
jgi:hypothetical protein